MADSKITALTALTAADPVNDMFPVVDVSDTSMAASGTTKRISVNNILSSSPTASGALTVTGLVTAGSATITGAATVGTTLGVTGVSTFAAGTALLPALTTTGDTNTGIYYPAADTFAVTTAGVERYRVDSSGNVGIGVTPSAWHSDYKVLQVKGSSFSNNGGTSNLWIAANLFINSSLQNTYIATAAATRYQQSSGVHIWDNAPSGTAGNPITFTQAMTLDASGNLLVGTPSGTLFRIISSFLSSSGNGGIKLIDSLDNHTAIFANFSNSTVTLGSITNNSNTGVLYNVTSDKRLKENISDSESASLLIDSLQVRKFDWKANNSHQRYGFIAQELVTVVPEAVYQPTNSDDMMAVDYSKLVPVLVKEIQSLRTRVQTLEAR